MGMRLDRFGGMVPKEAPMHLPDGGAAFAEDCYFTDGNYLSPETLPSIIPHNVYDVHGEILTAAPLTLWHVRDDIYVGWTEHVEITTDYRKFPYPDAFLFVQGGILYRLCGDWLLRKLGPQPVGMARPLVSPTVATSDTAFQWSAAPTDLPTTKQDCPTICPDGAQPGESRSYIFTYVNAMGEESAPSEPSEPVLVPINTTMVVTDPTTSVPANAVSRRWYRTLAGEHSSSFRFIRETPVANTSFLDVYDALQLGDVLDTASHWPPPPNLMGVGRLGGDQTVVWQADGSIHVSTNRLPHSYPPVNRYRVPDQIRRMVSTVARFEGRTSFYERGVSYSCFVLTDGHPWILVYEPGREDHSVSLHEYLIDEPIVSPRMACDGEGLCYYASTRGLVRLTYGEMAAPLSPLFSRRQWTELQPHKGFLAYNQGRLFFFGPQKNWYLPLGSFTQDRQSFLSYVTTPATAASSTPRALVLGQAGNMLLQWDGGSAPRRAIWHSGEFQQSEMWNPGALKVDTDLYRWATMPRAEEAWQHYLDYVTLYGQCAAKGFFKVHPQYDAYAEYIRYRLDPVKVEIFRDGKPFCTKFILSNYPMRLPRQGKGIYWSVRITTRYPVYRVQLAKGIMDLVSASIAQQRSYVS